MKTNWRRTLAIGAITTGAACLLVEAGALLVWARAVTTPAPPALGNSPAVTALLQRPGADAEPFSFAVVGDINGGMATFDKVLARLRGEKIEFVVQLGDVDDDPTVASHRLFRSEFARQDFDVPTFVTAGNHDIKAKPDRCTVADFERMYGPADFFIEFRGVLVIGLGRLIDPARNRDSLDFLEATLRQHAAGKRGIFVCLHYPPPAVPGFPSDDFPDSRHFLDLVRQFHVNYVLSGHYHELVHVQSADTMFIVTGGGGAALRKQPPGKEPGFHHAIVFDVTSAGIKERILPVHAASVGARLLWAAQFWAGGKVASLLLTSPAKAAAMNAVVLLLLALAAGDLRRQRRRGSRLTP